jgi:hypothetical protein
MGIATGRALKTRRNFPSRQILPPDRVGNADLPVRADGQAPG